MKLEGHAAHARAVPCPTTGQRICDVDPRTSNYVRCPHMNDEIWLHHVYEAAGVHVTGLVAR